MLELRGLARFAERHLVPGKVLVTREVGEDVLDRRVHRRRGAGYRTGTRARPDGGRVACRDAALRPGGGRAGAAQRLRTARPPRDHRQVPGLLARRRTGRRHYAQPPFPHLGPAVDQAAPEVFGEWELGLLARAVVIAELLDEDGERTLPVTTTPGVPDWNTVGLCRYGALSVETTGRGFLGDDE
ncbi:hypothetical protein [Streptomyces rimosus]